MSWHSDNRVDSLVADIFGDHIGHACEVGANDGKRGSNTLAFEEMGWTVLCIEPNPYCSSEGRSRRKLWRTVACGATDCEAHDFSVYGVEKTTPSFPSLGVGSRYDASMVPSEVLKVRVLRLDRVLEEAGFPKLDYLAVDVEGWEDEVMDGFTVERWKPKVIVLESWYDDKARTIPGYDIVQRLLYDNVYKRRSE